MPEIINFQDLPNYKPGAALFPNIPYDPVDLARTRTTIKGAYTNLRNCGQDKFIEELEPIWNPYGDINWQNQMLSHLQSRIFEMIKEWSTNKEDHYLLTKIFVWIQLWGGNMSRGFFIHANGGFENNFILVDYLQAIQNLKNEPLDSLYLLNGMNQMGTAFASKHMMFWSQGDLPIYDSIIALGVYGRLSVNNKKIAVYGDYLNDINEVAKQLNIPVAQIERSLFNYFDSVEGRNWLAFRRKK